MTVTTSGVVILSVMGFLLFWLTGECVREPWDSAKRNDNNKETPQYKAYVRTLKKTCKNTTLFGKIIIVWIISIFLLPSVIFVPIMHFLKAIFKAAMFKRG